MIPEFDPQTGYLPPGIHQGAWDEVVGRFGGNSHRSRLIVGLLAACRNLAEAGCRFVAKGIVQIDLRGLP